MSGFVSAAEWATLYNLGQTLASEAGGGLVSLDPPTWRRDGDGELIATLDDALIVHSFNGVYRVTATRIGDVAGQ